MEQGAVATNVKAVWQMKVFLKCKAKRGKNLKYSVALTYGGDHKIES